MQELKLIREGTYARLRAPIAVIYEVSHRCNLRCSFCYSNSGSRTGMDTSLPRARQILAAIKKAEVLHVELMGGELFLLDEWDVVLRLAREMGFCLSLVSNGTCIDPDVAEVVAEHVDSSGVSFRGPDASLHDKITGVQGSFASALEGLRNLRRAGTPVGVVYDAVPANHSYLFDTVERIIKREGISLDFVSANRIAPSGRALRATRGNLMSFEQYSVLFDQLERVAVEFSMSVEIGDAFPLCRLKPRQREFTTLCEFGVWRATIGPNGGVRGCPCSHQEFGNVLTSGMETIWMAHCSTRSFVRMEWLPDQCHACGLLSECGGGCPHSLPGSTGPSPDVFYQGQRRPPSVRPAKLGHVDSDMTAVEPFADGSKPRLSARCWFRDDIDGIICVPLDTALATYMRLRTCLLVDDLERSVMELCTGEHSVKEMRAILSSRGYGTKTTLKRSIANVLHALAQFGYLHMHSGDAPNRQHLR